jgi:transcription antitermination factor NusG
MEMGNIERAAIHAGLLASPDALRPAFHDPRQWHVLVVAPNHERKSADWLRETHHRVYFPNYSVHVRSRGGQRRTIVRALIPGYLFLATAPEADVDGLVDDVPGLVRCLRDEKRNLYTVPEWEIERLRQIEADFNLPGIHERPIRKWRVGERCRTVERLGLPWQGVVVGLDSRDRIIVEVKGLLGRATKVTLAPFQIEPI